LVPATRVTGAQSSWATTVATGAVQQERMQFVVEKGGTADPLE
jgi:hypothetical protein